MFSDCLKRFVDKGFSITKKMKLQPGGMIVHDNLT